MMGTAHTYTEMQTLDICNPFNNEVVKVLPIDGRTEVLEALSKLSSYDYRLSGWQRYQILSRLCSLVEKHAAELQQTISLESGKTLRDSAIEIKRACQVLLLSAEEAKRINGELIPLDSVAGMDSGFAMVSREPLGIVAAITP